jgi:hypothetical protein
LPLANGLLLLLLDYIEGYASSINGNARNTSFSKTA